MCMPSPGRQEQVFLTGLCAVSRSEVEKALQRWGSFRGAGFRLEFHPLHLSSPRREKNLRDMAPPDEFIDALRPPELWIITTNRERADLTASLLYAAHTLLDGCIPFGEFEGWNPYRAYSIQEAPGDGTFRFQSSQVTCVAALASRLSRRRSFVEAAFNFLSSVYLFSFDPWHFHPRYGIGTLARRGDLMNRVWEVQSLFAAYQVIECLDVVVKGASSDRPSVTNGVWDDGIRSDLESRLARIGVPPGQQVIWTARGNNTLNQKKFFGRTSTSTPVEWNSGHIRDHRVQVIDAINRANWLRSNVTAHRSKGRVERHHPLDTHNVQMLARYLLMSAINAVPLASPKTTPKRSNR